jgi:hypothetical protein
MQNQETGEQNEKLLPWVELNHPYASTLNILMLTHHEGH